MKIIKIRRPMGILFLLLILGILIWNHFRENKVPSPWEQEQFICIGRVTDIVPSSSGKVIYLSKIQELSQEKTPFLLQNILLYPSVSSKTENDLFSSIQIGNEIQVKGTLKTFEKSGNPGEFDSYSYYEAKQITARVYAKKIKILDTSSHLVKQFFFVWREKMMRQLSTVMGEKDAGILGAMILGDKSRLDADIKELYQQTGVAHMLAISGLHISLLGGVLFDWLRKYLLPMKMAVIVTMILLLLYGQFTGFPVATSRAVWMLWIRLLARYCGKTYDGFTAWSISGCMILIQNPLQLFQCGFVMSFVTAGGILLFQEMTEEKQKKMEEWKKTLCVTIWTFFVTLPVLLWYFYEICIYSIVANLILLPLLSFLLGIGILGCVLCLFWPLASGFILASAHWILSFYEWVCQMINQLPCSTWVMGRPELWKIVVYYLILFLALYFWGLQRDNRKMAVCMSLLSGILMIFTPQFEFQYVQLDVGQGDCACIFCGNKTFLIDGGSTTEKEIGKYRIGKFLKFYGRKEIQAVFITHGDEDHVSGIRELIQSNEKLGIRIQKIYIPQLQKKEEGLAKLEEIVKKSGISVQKIKKGNQLRCGKMKLTCLHPAPNYDWEDANDSSLTLEIRYENLSLFTTGDLGERGEEQLQLKGQNYDILKVGHHGSKYSSSDSFLQQISPKYGFISAGYQNRYGHPSKDTLERLEKHSCIWWNTAEKGALFAEYRKKQKRCWHFKD